ncbi:Acetylcholinesterase [Trichinella spiralis]|uniref:Acetylcholinesterase n=1 Tax=Trichinella spiralis TaxID=6334 RepID=A0ABR3K2X1_TRISP
MSHLLAKNSWHLFNNAILQSGTMNSSWATVDREILKNHSRELASSLGCSGSDLELLRCLRKLPAQDIQSKSEKMWNGKFLSFLFAPVINDELFFGEESSRNLITGNMKKTTILVCFNSDEGSFWLPTYMPKFFNNIGDGMISRTQFYSAVEEAFGDFQNHHQLEQVMEYYLANYANERDALSAMIGDFYFTCDLLYTVHLVTDKGVRVYLSQFDYRSERNPWPQWMGSMHGYEIEFIFGVPLRPENGNYSPHDQFISKLLMEYWSSFVYDSQPTANSTAHVKWPLYTAENPAYLMINESGVSVQWNPLKYECSLMRQLKLGAVWKMITVASEVEAEQVDMPSASKKNKEVKEENFKNHISSKAAVSSLLGSGGGHRWCFGKVKSADHRLKSRPKAVEEYEKEESEILEQIEKIRLSRKKTSLATFSGAACWRRRAEWRSFNQSTSECGSSLLSTSATMMQPMPGDLLTSMCHLMNFVVHLRRENRHLRRQIVCLDEMRKVERLQCEILQSACACIAVNRRQSNNASSLDAESGYEASNCSQLATEGPTAGSQLIFNSLNHQRTDSNNTTTDTSSVQSPTSTSHLNRAPLFLSKTDDHFLDCNQLVKNDHPIQPSLSTTKQHNLLKPMDPSRRDSDDQVIFSEVLLPNYNSSSNSGAKKLPLQNRQSLPINHCSSTSSTACYAPLSFPETNSGRVSRLLERFGIKRHSWKKSIRSSASVEEERRRQSERGATSEPHLHHGSSSSPTFSQLRPRTELIFHNSSNKQRLLAGRKAFLKKRKRKISESDSWASSEASKVYSVIEIPEKLDLKFRGLATKPFSLVKKKDGFDEASFSADVPRKEAMDSVMVENQFYLDDSVEPAKESTTVPLRTTRQAMRITSPEKALLHHASVDKQRISEKCQSNDNNNISETNINHLDQLDKTVQNNPPSQLSLQPDSANYFRTDPGLSNLLQTAGVNLSLTPSQMTVSNDSVFTSHETDLNRYVSGMNVLKQLLALQEKNSILIRQLREKTSEYESIVERVANLEGSMKTLRNRLKFNNLLESLFERNIEKHCVPLSVVKDLENHIRTLEQNIQEMKAETYHDQQLTMEANAKQQIINQQYWEKLESLLISKEFFENDNKKSNKEENYQSLFVFTVKLLRKLHTVRNSLLEKLNAYSNVNVELMQTQSSLLLAHAQIERQRLEIQQLSNRNARIRRADSYHGQDLVEKLVNSKFSFYLPFKLYGSRMTTVGGEKKKKDPRSCLPDEMLEAEFASFIQSMKNYLPKDSSSDAVAMQAFSQTKQLNSNNNSTPPIGRGISKSEKEPRNSGIDIRQRTTMSGGFEGSTSRLPASLLVKKQSPSLQRLSKMGHVRALAATFDSPNGLKVDEKYPPGTSMNPFEYSLHYGQQNFHCHHQQDAKRSQHHDSETSSSAAAAAEKPPAPAPATTISQSSKIPAFGNFATVTRLRRATDAVSDVKNANCRETFSTTTTTTTTTTRFCNKTTTSPKVPVTGASNQDRKINFTANKANTFAGRITSESEEISRKKNNNAALLASTMSTTSSVSCLKSNIPTNVVNIREVSNRTATPKSISRSVTNQFLPIKSANICYDKELRNRTSRILPMLMKFHQRLQLVGCRGLEKKCMVIWKKFK